MERDQGAGFPIVGIGASAGGLEAFMQLLRALPLDTGMAFVLVQHLDRDHESALAQILSRATSLPVREITNDEAIQANHVYIIPPDANLRITGGVLRLEQRPRTRAPHRSIDFFFESLAQDQHERAVGVVLSGTATDGTLGLEAIKAEGGITFAQDDSAKYDSMPRSAAAAGCVDRVLSPAEIAKELARIARHPSVVRSSAFSDSEGERAAPPSGGPKSRASGAAQGGYRKILLLLRNHSGVDFSLYKASTIQRRLTRRLVLNQQDTVEDYAGFLRGNAKELDALHADLLISVTSFFRNPEAFDVLQEKVLPELLAQRGDDPLRCWVPGCSTGQEAYSIAIAFMEVAENAGDPMRRLQIFATDVNDTLLDKARHGLYAKSLVEGVKPERLRRFFVEENGGYRVSKALREMVLFARQNLIADPPFSRMDLISCRNLLIYLEPSLQHKAIPTFHYALRAGGFLFLGASESIGGFTELFEPVDTAHKIYSKKLAPTPALHLPVGRERSGRSPDSRLALPTREPGGAELPDPSLGDFDARREAERIIVHRFAPPGVLVNAELQVLQFHGSTGAFLEPPTGRPSFNVLNMARKELMLPLRSTIEQAKKGNKSARKDDIPFRQNGKPRAVNLEVIPLKNLRERCFLILFEEAGRRGEKRELPEPRAARPTRPLGRERPGRIAELEAELSEAREHLRSMQEQHEAASEELQAAHEEVQSANEELQSINEELETSKEELESSNEELTTLNEEVSNRNVRLNDLNNDLINLQASTKLPIVLLGRDLEIRRFSPEAEKQFNLRSTDVRRPISQIRHDLIFGDAPDSPLDLADLGREVISELREQQREVRDGAGRWHSLRVRPYMTVDNKVDGAVLVLVNIDSLKRLEAELRKSSAELSEADRRKDEFLAMLGHELRNPLAALTNGLELLGKVSGDRARSEQVCQMLVRQTERIGTLLDQLLDISRAIAGKIVLSNDPVDLAQVVRAAVETVRAFAASRRNEITLSLPEESVFVTGDAVRLTQVVENLLTNAIKYTGADGHVGVAVEASDAEARIIVRDTGSGISAEFLPHVFETFTQAPRTLDRATGGLGLGLSLVRRLVEMHGGKVSAASGGLGQGSEFTVTLPLRHEQRLHGKRSLEELGVAPTSLEATKVQPRRILVVDDEKETANALEEVLRLDGHRVLAVHDGLAALAAVRTFDPEVVLLDLGLPELDGYEIAGRLRQEEHGDRLLLLALTGYQRDTARLRQAGFDQHMLKPLNRRRLSRLLAAWDHGTRPVLPANS